MRCPSAWSLLCQRMPRVLPVNTNRIGGNLRLIHLVLLSGGLITTAFQIGSALGLAICSIPQHTVFVRQQRKGISNDKEVLLMSFAAGLWTSMGMAVVALLLATVGMKWGIRPNRPDAVVEQTAEVTKQGEEKV